MAKRMGAKTKEIKASHAGFISNPSDIAEKNMTIGNNLVTILAMSAQRRYNAVQCDLIRIARKNNGFQRHCNAKPIFESHVRILVPQFDFPPVFPRFFRVWPQTAGPLVSIW